MNKHITIKRIVIIWVYPNPNTPAPNIELHASDFDAMEGPGWLEAVGVTLIRPVEVVELTAVELMAEVMRDAAEDCEVVDPAPWQSVAI